MIVRPTRHHTQIEIDVRLTRDEYSVNALITIASLLIHRGFTNHKGELEKNTAFDCSSIIRFDRT